MANNVDPDETPHSVASHLGLYCLLRLVCQNTYGKYGILEEWNLTNRIVRSCSLDSSREKWINYYQTVETPISGDPNLETLNNGDPDQGLHCLPITQLLF